MELPYNVRTQLNDINAFSLAFHAGVQNPDSLESAGAKMLTDIMFGVVERVEDLDGDAMVDADSLRDALDDELHEVADNAPDVYTHARWLQFVDLAGYNVDLSEFGEVDGNNVTDDVAGRALYLIARDVVDACVTLIGEAMSEHVTRAVERASTLGADEGRNAADWWAQDAMGGRSPGDAAVTARAVLAGFADGDPQFLDGLPSADFSGQFADRSTVGEVLSLVDLDGFDGGGQVAMEVLDAFSQAYDTAVEAHLVDVATSVIRAAD